MEKENNDSIFFIWKPTLNIHFGIESMITGRKLQAVNGITQKDTKVGLSSDYWILKVGSPVLCPEEKHSAFRTGQALIAWLQPSSDF